MPTNDDWWSNQPLASKAPVTLDTPATPPTGQAAQAAYTKVAALRSMRKQLNHVHDLYDRDMSAKGAAALNEYNPFRSKNQEFDGAVAAIPLLARQAFRVPGSGADSDRELKLITDALPSRWSFDATNGERFKTLDGVTADTIANNAGLAGYSPAQVKMLRGENTYVPLSQRGVRTPPPAARGPAQRRVIDINGKPVQ